MSRSLNSSRSTSLRSRHGPSVPASDLCFDTALPPMSSKELVTTTAARRHFRDSESSIVMHNLRANPKAAAALGINPDAMPTLIARNGSSHRRSGSTLKTVMRKIFTRKRRSDTDSLEDQDFRSSHPQTLRKYGDVSADRCIVFPNSLGSKHSNPPSRDHDPPIPLNDALEKLQSRPPRRRRATLPSLIFSDDDESRDTLEAVVHSDRTGNSTHAQSDDEIRQMRRRSRSANALRSLAKDHRMSPIQWRRRSIESYVTTYGGASDSDLSPRPPTRTTIASVITKPSTDPSIYTRTDEEEEDDTESIAIPPNVSTLVNSMQHDENVSLEQRLTTLEVKLIDLEFAIARMQNGRGDPSPTDMQSKKVADTTAASRQHRRKQSSSHTPQSGTSTPSVESVPAAPAAERPLSTSTIRPTPPPQDHSPPFQRPRLMPSLGSMNDGHGISVEQYSALVMLLRREQTARRALEGEVSSLRDDVRQLQRMASDPIGIGTMYPIRSAESSEFLRIRSGLTTDSPRSEKVGSPYESDSDWERGETQPPDDVFRSRWKSARRIEVGGMI
ncbi:hypothetical protein FE257_009679 [Aspergillus nanangensis]|uniref:Uncharacterized protein n=1 Tax=Aspergillus nanangensis TaxID=2582783 RepID=A0AAD4GSM1_ASPNN|nr:hypothetical protein FE257_009679 [Aspergillus nanangensis]